MFDSSSSRLPLTTVSRVHSSTRPESSWPTPRVSRLTWARCSKLIAVNYVGR